MKGHDHIIKLRKAGYRPKAIFIFDEPTDIDQPSWVEDLTYMDVCTHGDSIGSLDLRFLVGVPVTVIGPVIERAKSLAVECRKAGASRVIVKCGDKCAMWTKGETKWLSF